MAIASIFAALPMLATTVAAEQIGQVRAGSPGSGPGGAAAGAPPAGGSGASTGPGPVNQSQYGPPASKGAPAPATPSAPAQARNLVDLDSVARGDLCGDYRLGAMVAAERLRSPNLRRLDFAQRYLAPGFDAGKNQTGVRILASYQEEMERPRPDPLVAGTYIAMVSTVPVTDGLVEQLNAILCVSGAPKRISAIAAAARQQKSAR
ncbi:MAG: hypothetical protein IPK81_09935 [Rhodospirillales bacterium]|nr:MAG: hypothetical protein IPK81_09935 [Rhodospirillales bacterium]